MRMGDLHTHSVYCDGQGCPADYAAAAVDARLEAVGFSAHAPVPFGSEWHMSRADLGRYLSEGLTTKRRYAGRLGVFVGLEVDYIPGVLSPSYATIDGRKPDFVIGSVHFLGALAGGRRWTVDGPRQEFLQGIDETFGGRPRAAVEAYYGLVRRMVAHDPPQVVGHLDLVKKNNQGDFDEEAPWYVEVVERTVEAIAAADCIVEINTGGVSRGYRPDFYPSEWIVRRLCERGVPITISSDAHRPEHVAAGFSEAASLLGRAGGGQVQVLTETGWVARTLADEEVQS